MNYVGWAILGMIGYSLVTLFVKLAIRSGQFSSFLVLAIATAMVATCAVSIAVLRGDLRALEARDFTTPSAFWAYATGIAHALARRVTVPGAVARTCKRGRAYLRHVHRGWSASWHDFSQ